MPGHDQVLTTKAHLGLRESLNAPSLQEATVIRREAEAILKEQIADIGSTDEYPYHVYLTQGLAWIRRWGPLLDGSKRKDFLEELDNLASDAIELHRTRRIRGISEAIRREYLGLAVK
jgi:hypothetical protein